MILDLDEEPKVINRIRPDSNNSNIASCKASQPPCSQPAQTADPQQRARDPPESPRARVEQANKPTAEKC